MSKYLTANEDLTEKQIAEIEKRFARKTGDHNWDVRSHLNDYDTSKWSIDYLVTKMVDDWYEAK